MQRVYGWVILVVAVLTLVALAVRRNPVAADTAAASDAGAVSLQGLQLQGSASCAASACHNGNGPKGAPGSEYSTWVLHDKHARAFEVLSEARSQQMVRNLYGPKAAPAEKTALCLNCHVQPGIEPLHADGKPLPRHERFSLEDGVSCEACHGPAEKWLAEHYRRDWRAKPAAEKRKEGFINTKDLTERAQACIVCHVGSGDMEVNHDLIAAGHPRLNFEYGVYLANVPKHWSDRKEKERYPDLEARAWAVGQVACAAASLRLLAHRAAVAEKPWPEFAEYNCFACHHDLADEKWRRDPRHVKGRPGALPWGDWYLALADEFPRLHSAPPAAGLSDSIQEIRKALERSNPDRAKVGAKAKELAGQLESWLPAIRQRSYDAGGVRSLLDAFGERAGKELTSYSWDQAAQLYLALEAANYALHDLDRSHPDPRKSERLKGLFDKLTFPQRYDSPRGFDPAKLGTAPTIRGN